MSTALFLFTNVDPFLFEPFSEVFCNEFVCSHLLALAFAPVAGADLPAFR